jgi:hypothetical protein
MAEKNSSRRVESSLKRTRFLGHPGLIAGVFRELEVDKLIDDKLPKERDHNVPHSVLGVLCHRFSAQLRKSDFVFVVCWLPPFDSPKIE